MQISSERMGVVWHYLCGCQFDMLRSSPCLDYRLVADTKAWHQPSPLVESVGVCSPMQAEVLVVRVWQPQEAGMTGWVTAAVNCKGIVWCWPG